jgi:hypothetical protein
MRCGTQYSDRQSHECAVWIPSVLSSKGMLETWQYKAAKLIVNTNMTIPKSAQLLIINNKHCFFYLFLLSGIQAAILFTLRKKVFR